jgi:hypothetical protein
MGLDEDGVEQDLTCLNFDPVCCRCPGWVDERHLLIHDRKTLQVLTFEPNIRERVLEPWTDDLIEDSAVAGRNLIFLVPESIHVVDWDGKSLTLARRIPCRMPFCPLILCSTRGVFWARKQETGYRCVEVDFDSGEINASPLQSSPDDWRDIAVAQRNRNNVGWRFLDHDEEGCSRAFRSSLLVRYDFGRVLTLNELAVRACSEMLRRRLPDDASRKLFATCVAEWRPQSERDSLARKFAPS